MDGFEFKRHEDLDNLSKVPIILVKIEEMSKRLDSMEDRFAAELEKVGLRLEKVESLRERLAETEAIVNNHTTDINNLRGHQEKQVQSTIDFLRKLTIEFGLVIIGLFANIVFTLLKK